MMILRMTDWVRAWMKLVSSSFTHSRYGVFYQDEKQALRHQQSLLSNLSCIKTATSHKAYLAPSTPNNRHLSPDRFIPRLLVTLVVGGILSLNQERIRNGVNSNWSKHCQRQVPHA